MNFVARSKLSVFASSAATLKWPGEQLVRLPMEDRDVIDGAPARPAPRLTRGYAARIPRAYLPWGAIREP